MTYFSQSGPTLNLSIITHQYHQIINPRIKELIHWQKHSPAIFPKAPLLSPAYIKEQAIDTRAFAETFHIQSITTCNAAGLCFLCQEKAEGKQMTESSKQDRLQRRRQGSGHSGTVLRLNTLQKREKPKQTMSEKTVVITGKHYMRTGKLQKERCLSKFRSPETGLGEHATEIETLLAYRRFRFCFTGHLVSSNIPTDSEKKKER